MITAAAARTPDFGICFLPKLFCASPAPAGGSLAQARPDARNMRQPDGDVQQNLWLAANLSRGGDPRFATSRPQVRRRCWPVVRLHSARCSSDVWPPPSSVSLAVAVDVIALHWTIMPSHRHDGGVGSKTGRRKLTGCSWSRIAVHRGHAAISFGAREIQGPSGRDRRIAAEPARSGWGEATRRLAESLGL